MPSEIVPTYTQLSANRAALSLGWPSTGGWRFTPAAGIKGAEHEPPPPEVRSALHMLASDIEARGLEADARKLRALAEKTKRRHAVRRASPRARAVTPELEERIRQTAQAHQAWSLHEIGVACGVNQGRVSEVLAGFRE